MTLDKNDALPPIFFHRYFNKMFTSLCKNFLQAYS